MDGKRSLVMRLLLPLALLLAGGPVRGADLLVRNGYLIDMVSKMGEPRLIKGLLINGGKIERIIFADSKEPLPKADQVIDANALYILPGLIDSHVHFQPWFPAMNMYYGVTALMDTGPCGEECPEDPTEWILRFKKESILAGPNLYVTGIKLDGPDGKREKHVYRLQSLSEATAQVQLLANLGVDAIKVEEKLPADFRQRVIEEADKRNLPVVGHSKNAAESISVGMRFIEHPYPIARSLAEDPAKAEKLSSPEYMMDLSKAPAMIDLMIQKKVYFNPTLYGRFGSVSGRQSQYLAEDKKIISGELCKDIPDDLRQKWPSIHLRAEKMTAEQKANIEEGYRRIKLFIKQFSEQGGLILAGSDAAEHGVPGVPLHREMQLLVDAGVPPYVALLGATRWAAELMKKDDTIGTVQQGKQGDLIILSANPLQDIGATQRIEYVIKRGVIQRKPEKKEKKV